MLDRYFNAAPSIVVREGKVFLCWCRFKRALPRWSCASVRLDGFASYFADENDVSLVTAPVAELSDSRQLHVNARCSEREAGGVLTVQLVDTGSDYDLVGYSANECVQMSGDSTAHVVSWHMQQTLPVGRQFRLKFRFRKCDLFSFQAKRKAE